MWLILLDHSSSMGGGFEGEVPAGPMVRRVDAETRLAAAKLCFLEQLRRLPPDMPVMLVAFTSTARLLLTARADATARFEAALAVLTPENGTDIAAALHTAADIIEGLADPPPARKALLISDGESALEPAERAAERCRTLGLSVDVFVIDPDEKSELLARRISGRTMGRWDPVTTTGELWRASAAAAELLAQQSAAAHRMLEQWESEKQALEQARQGQPNVMFSAGYPGRIRANRSYPLLFSIHLEDAADTVAAKLKRTLSTLDLSPRVMQSDARSRIPRGSLLTVEPRIEDLVIHPRRAEVVWLEETQTLRFDFAYTGDHSHTAVLSGDIEVLDEQGLLVGRTPVSITVTADEGIPEEALPTVAQGRLLERVFASYAREDEAIVRACKEVYQALGIQFFIDRDNLASGQVWRNALQLAIAKSDLFQLYWSEDAARSSHVAEEWELALAIGEKGTGSFVRPLYWRRPMPKAPEKLKRLHFGYLDLSRLEVQDTNTASASRAHPTPRQLELEHQLTILPLSDKVTDQTIAFVRSSMGRVVAYLEELTGLRYIPPPTLLVDRFTVRAVRSMLTVDKPEESVPAGQPHSDLDWALDLLRSLLLAFHVGELEHCHNAADRFAFYGLVTETEQGDFVHLHRESEGSLVGRLHERLAGQDPFVQAEDWTEAIAEARKDDTFFGRYHLHEHLEDLAYVVEPGELQALETLFGVTFVKDGCFLRTNFDTIKLDTLRVHLQGPTFQGIALRYKARFYSLFRERTTLCQSPDFASYVRRGFELLLRYVDRALAQLGSIELEIGFAVPRQVLEAAIQHLPEVEIRIGRESRRFGAESTDEYLFSLSLASYRTCLQRLAALLLDTVVSAPATSQRLRTLIETLVPSYGIFMSANAKAAEAHIEAMAAAPTWPRAATLPGVHKVLLCGDAFDDLATQLHAAGEDEARIEEETRGCLLATLVHEHFHAILETGLDQSGRGAVAARKPALWQHGAVLNEALAAWAQRHFFRDDPWMFERVSEYITAGDYPEWPYCGAETIERLYLNDGLPAIRKLIDIFRDDAELAQLTFDERRRAGLA